MAQWLTSLTYNWWMPISRKFEPQQRLLLFPLARNFTLNAQYWLVQGTDLGVILICRIACLQSN